MTQLMPEVPEVLRHMTPDTFTALLAIGKVLRKYALDTVTTGTISIK